MDIFEARSARPMLIGSEGEPFDSPEYLFELKMDGERCLAYLDGRRTELINRRGRRVLPQFPELSSLHEQAEVRCILDGELIVGVGSKADFEHIKRRSLTKNRYAVERLSVELPAVFVAVDLLYLDHAETTNLPLMERQGLLRRAVRDGGRMSVVRTVERQGTKLYESVRAMGLEGIIGKRRDSAYLMGRRSRDWVKIKNWLSDLFIVCGFVVSAKANVASLFLGQNDPEGTLVYKGRVALGTGRLEFRRIEAQPRRATRPFREEPEGAAAGAVWLEPSLVCSVGFMCYTTQSRLRQPYFIGLRPDTGPSEAVERRPEADAAELCAVGGGASSQ